MVHFNLARKQKNYCIMHGYCHLNVRHPHARADSEMEKEHDTFSLVKVISTEFPVVKAQVKHISAVDESMDQSFSCACMDL